MALDLAQMVPEVRKNPKPTQFYMLNNFGFNNCLKILISGDVRAQVLQEPVGASHTDQAWIFGVQQAFSDLGGQDESDGTPHLALAPSFSHPQGGIVVQIKDAVSLIRQFFFVSYKEVA